MMGYLVEAVVHRNVLLLHIAVLRIFLTIPPQKACLGQMATGEEHFHKKNLHKQIPRMNILNCKDQLCRQGPSNLQLEKAVI